jgi:hypothetical protein
MAEEQFAGRAHFGTRPHLGCRIGMYRDLDGARLDRLRARLAELRKNEAEAREIERFLAMEDRRLSLPLLDNLRIASPCAQDWDEMAGDDRIRFCRRCQKNVYNLSSLTREEAERLVFEKEGRMCVRFYRRSDGTILTSDCPTGSRRVRWVRLVLASALATLLTAIGLRPSTPQPPPLDLIVENSSTQGLMIPPRSTRRYTYGGATMGMGRAFSREPQGSRFTGFEILKR